MNSIEEDMRQMSFRLADLKKSISGGTLIMHPRIGADENEARKLAEDAEFRKAREIEEQVQEILGGR